MHWTSCVCICLCRCKWFSCCHSCFGSKLFLIFLSKPFEILILIFSNFQKCLYVLHCRVRSLMGIKDLTGDQRDVEARKIAWQEVHSPSYSSENNQLTNITNRSSGYRCCATCAPCVQTRVSTFATPPWWYCSGPYSAKICSLSDPRYGRG